MKKKLCGAMHLVAALWLASGVAYASSADRFDLMCNLKGTESFHLGQVTDFPRHLSIDLKAGEWCVRDQNCDTIWKINRVTDNEIRLRDIDSSFMKLETSINRKMWTWESDAHIKAVIDSYGKTYGPCRRAPFTPFPKSQKVQ